MVHNTVIVIVTADDESSSFSLSFFSLHQHWRIIILIIASIIVIARSTDHNVAFVGPACSSCRCRMVLLVIVESRSEEDPLFVVVRGRLRLVVLVLSRLRRRGRGILLLLPADCSFLAEFLFRSAATARSYSSRATTGLVLTFVLSSASSSFRLAMMMRMGIAAAMNGSIGRMRPRRATSRHARFASRKRSKSVPQRALD
jgi:hypothetical protein